MEVEKLAPELFVMSHHQRQNHQDDLTLTTGRDKNIKDHRINFLEPIPLCIRSSTSVSSKTCYTTSSPNKWNASETSLNFEKYDYTEFACQFNREISYAGSRFHRPPKPTALPKPPSHWVNSFCLPQANHVCKNDRLDSIALQLKNLLKVQA